MASEAPGQAYAVGCDLPYRAILELLVRSGVPCSAFAHAQDDEQMDIMWVLCDASADHVSTLERAFAGLTGKDVLIITHDGMGYPRHRKAFLAEFYIHLPEPCPLRNLPHRTFKRDDFALARRLLRIHHDVDSFVMRRWDGIRQLDSDSPDGVEPLPATHVPRRSNRHRRPLILPPELIEAILENISVPELEDDGPLWWIPFDKHIVNSVADLNAAGLVCRSWLRASRRFVLRTAPLYVSPRTCTAFSELARSEQWRSCVRTLYLNFPFKYENADHDDVAIAVSTILSHFPDLHGLHFDNVDAAFMAGGSLSRIRLPTNLVSFGFRAIGFGETRQPNMPFQFLPHATMPLPSLPRLRTLSLCGVQLSGWKNNPSFANLRRLFMFWTRPQGGQFSDFFLDLQHSPLVKLALGQTVVATSDVVQFLAHSETMREFLCTTLAQPPGRFSWTHEGLQTIRNALNGQVDINWNFPHLPT